MTTKVDQNDERRQNDEYIRQHDKLTVVICEMKLVKSF
jgi:hypothetical protein